MIRHPWRALFAVGGGWLAMAGAADAQYPYPPAGYQPGGAYGTPARPPISPYLNIFQGGGNPAVNYYNFTRPALQNQQFYQQQQAYGLGGGYAAGTYGMGSTDPLYAPPGMAPNERMPPPTGHQTVFMNYAGYFNSLGTIGGSAPGRGGQAGGAPQPQVPTTPRR